MKEIFNIFSKTEKRISLRKIQKLKIIADYREKNSLVFSELIRFGCKIEVKTLAVADFIINNVAIERKTISDFISSVINKRIFRQLEEIKQYPNPLIIVEGIDEQELYDDRNEGVSANAIRGMILSIILKYKVPIIFTKDAKDTASFIYILAKKPQKKEFSLNPKKRTKNVEEQKQYILEGFPGIGPATAKKLLQKFKTIKNIINASQEELKKTLGKKAEIFEKIIDGE